MSSKGTVIVFGLDGVNRIPGGHPAHVTPEWILNGVKKSTEDANSAGWDSEYFLFDHEDKQLIDKVATKLKEKKWDVVCIGGGVRFNPELTWLFEDVTNAAVTLVSPPPKFVFQSQPHGLLERLQYQFPDKS